MLDVIDVDQHIYEPRSCWRDHIDPAHRDDALTIEDDDLGYAWLTWRGRRLYLAEFQEPGNAKAIGNERLRIARGEPAESTYDERVPTAYSDPKARLAKLDAWGLNAAALGPDLFMFGSDWPHAEGTAEPRASYEVVLDALAPDAREALMGGNARRLLNV